MLDQETGLRGFVLTRKRGFLEPYENGRRDYELAWAAAAADGRGDRTLRANLTQQLAATRRWQDLAESEIVSVGARNRPAASAAVTPKQVMDRFRVLNAAYQRAVSTRRDAELTRAGYELVAIIGFFGITFGLIAYFAVERTARRRAQEREAELTYRSSQHELSQTLQVAQTEDEAYGTLKRHLERVLTGAEVVALNRNNSANRLEPATPVASGNALAVSLDSATPDSCAAIRTTAPYKRSPTSDPLLPCRVCGEIPGATMCVPSVIGGEVIGSVLVTHGESTSQAAAQTIQESVSQAAPVLANLRNLRFAETRAATDPRTGLPNSRALEDTLERMVALAGRQSTPLAAALIDIDHFKRVNDRYGHHIGDEALRAVAQALSGGVRRSDVVGRYGGEEFLLLLPDTTRDAALNVAEKLRRDVERTTVSGVAERITASFGVAILPDDAVDATGLLRRADAALYEAKAQGRNRVESAANLANSNGDGAVRADARIEHEPID